MESMEARGSGGLHIENAVVVRILEIRRSWGKSQVKVSWTIGNDEPTVLWLDEGDFLTSHFSVALDDFKISAKPLLTIPDAP